MELEGGQPPFRGECIREPLKNSLKLQLRSVISLPLRGREITKHGFKKV